MKIRIAAAAAAVAIAVPLTAGATDGYFSHGYGMKSIGMGGTGVAFAEEPFGAAMNPGTMSFLDSRWQLGAGWFSPRRSASRSGSGMANIDGNVDSDSTNFVIPEFGINWKYRPDLAFGLAVYGNGGMNTNYPGGQISPMSACGAFNPRPGPYNMLCGNGNLGVDLMQLMISPYVSWQFVPNHSVGVAPVLAYQRFKAEGLQAFDNPFLSTSPGNVTGGSYSSSWGGGVRIGYMGQLTKQVSLGATYATKMYMGSFSDYKGLFAQGGDFDIPSTFTLGAAFRPTEPWLLALEFQRIYYNQINAVGDQSNLIFNCAAGQRDACLGGSNGAGFGWENISVWKLGAQYALNERWTVRAGYNHSGNPVTPQNVTFNILAPGVVQNHYTAGVTFAVDKVSEISGAFFYAPNNSVTGQSLFTGFGAPPTTSETIQMKEYYLGIAYARKF